MTHVLLYINFKTRVTKRLKSIEQTYIVLNFDSAVPYSRLNASHRRERYVL